MPARSALSGLLRSGYRARFFFQQMSHTANTNLCDAQQQCESPLRYSCSCCSWQKQNQHSDVFTSGARIVIPLCADSVPLLYSLFALVSEAELPSAEKPPRRICTNQLAVPGCGRTLVRLRWSSARSSAEAVPLGHQQPAPDTPGIHTRQIRLAALEPEEKRQRLLSLRGAVGLPRGRASAPKVRQNCRSASGTPASVSAEPAGAGSATTDDAPNTPALAGPAYAGKVLTASGPAAALKPGAHRQRKNLTRMKAAATLARCAPMLRIPAPGGADLTAEPPGASTTVPIRATAPVHNTVGAPTGHSLRHAELRHFRRAHSASPRWWGPHPICVNNRRPYGRKGTHHLGCAEA